MKERKWIVKFAYSGSSRREFYDKEFTLLEGESIDKVIMNYVQEQNRGEAKSDKIRYWSKTPSLLPTTDKK